MAKIRLAMLSTVGIALVAGYLHLQAAPLSGSRALPHARQAQTEQSSGSAAAVAAQRALLDKYCVSCHNERLKTAGLMLDQMDLGQVGEHGEVWEKVVRKLRGSAMPPAGAPRPEKAAHDGLVAWLEAHLDGAAAANTPPRRPLVHRLNRMEYTNAIRDLLDLEIDGRALLPADEYNYGFDDIADALSVTPGLLDRYMVVAHKISRLAVGDPTLPVTREKYAVSQYLVQDNRVSDELPFMSRGGAAIHHYFPLDGEYVVTIRLRRAQQSGIIEGLNKREQLDVSVDGARISLFNVGGECVGSTEPKCVKVFLHLPTSEYDRTADAGLHVRFPAKAGSRLVSVAFANGYTVPEGAGPERQPQGNSPIMSVANVDIEGPFNVTGPGDTPSRRKIFVCQPTGAASEEPCAKKILATLARRAYRRPVTDQDVELLLGFYRTGRSQGGFEAGVRSALRTLLVSPNFLVRTEGAPATATVRPASTASTASRISDLELASRLSFFLWSSIPDDELLDVAARGKLSDSKVLEQQVRRMLADPRASSLVTNFASEWLYLRDLRAVRPDMQVFPDFDDSLRAAFERETELFLESQVSEDRPLIELLTANYTFANEQLARFYGIPNVYGSHFRRVTMTDPNRRGLLGQGSILTVTSYSTRTSPTVRGKYLLTNILGSPPPPPPANVPALKENGESGEAPTSVRARLEAHRKNPVCASCHARMDPLGFALENFTAIGKWRTTEAESPINTAGVMPDGTKFSNPTEFREALLGQRDEFVRTVTERLLTYALGRGVEYYDMPAVRAIVRNAAPDYRWSSLVVGIVKSAPFQGTPPRGAGPEMLKRAN
jgi:mono/diheme cytochrome c family protein